MCCLYEHRNNAIGKIFILFSLDADILAQTIGIKLDDFEIKYKSVFVAKHKKPRMHF